MSRLGGPNSSSTTESGSNAARSGFESAIDYVNQVKTAFHNDSEKYDEFLNIIKSCSKRSVKDTLRRLKKLFKNNPELVSGFKTFLPEGYRMSLALPDSPPLTNSDSEAAYSFKDKVKARFSNDKLRWLIFVYVLEDYRDNRRSIDDVHHEMYILFRDHEDLLKELPEFLSDTRKLSTANKRQTRSK